MDYDLIVRGGLIYDGSGGEPFRGDVAIRGDEIAAVGDAGPGRGATEVDAAGLAVAPGFINMLSWASEALIEDGRSQSDIRQGVTLEVMGEGSSMGPLTEAMAADMEARQGRIRYTVAWRTLGGYLDWLAARGVATNVASFVGATTVRVHEAGYEDRPPTPDELARMGALVRQAMAEGAVGVSSALVYPPASFAATEELIALARASAESGGLYISHLRSEGARLLEALEELITVAREAGSRAEVYHLKAAGQPNWHKLEPAIQRIERARAEGLAISADMYTYTAGGTALDATMPPRLQADGHAAWMARLKDPANREAIVAAIRAPAEDWENFYWLAGSPENILLASVKNEALRPLVGQTLAQVAAARGTTPEETILDLVIEDEGHTGAVYFLMSEDNVRREAALPWVTFGSDAQSLAPEGVFAQVSTHPRAYGNFARLLGRYVREEGLLPLEAAIHRLTALPAENLRLRRRGRLRPGYYADVAVFDPARVADHATFARPHQYATGMAHVLVNGVPVLRDGEHTGARPGRVVRGPGAVHAV
jgi:N-acyl-D-amino-acid deacylase